MTDPDVIDTQPARLAYRLDDLTIDVGTAQVHRNGQLVPLPRLSFDLLIALIKAAPSLVTVDELMDRVWPGVVVSAETVSQRVKLLRVALDDDARQPRYIAVSRGRGYRIIAPVRTLDLAGATNVAEAAGQQAPAQPGRPRQRWIWAAAVALVFVVLAALFIRDRPAPGADSLSTATIVTAAPDRSVAVLPFDNLGQSPQDAALAFGVAETLLHRLSSSKDLTVIARQSSFSFAPRGADAREIGRKLNVRYLVEGSLQSTPERLRITAQLIDASTGSHVWSLQFDRKPEDIFVIQDEIADKVAEAMRLSLSGTATARDNGTQNFDAYLAYAQGRARLATSRLADAKLAITDFERATKFDPMFAGAYVGQAEAQLFVADNEMSRERSNNLQKAHALAGQLLQRALEIDERNFETHLQLAGRYWSGEPADRELARALELNPNSAAAYALLANFRLWRDRLPDEAMSAIDKARQLSPLEVQYDLQKVTLALYGKSNAKLAEELARSVLERNPSSSIALSHLGEIQWCCRMEQAQGIQYLEQALRSDPDNEFFRRILMKAYLDLGETNEAQSIAASAAHPVDARRVMVLVRHHEWAVAAQRTYEEDRLRTSTPIEGDNRSLAVRMQARRSGDFQPALQYLAKYATVAWDANGLPSLSNSWMSVYAVGLADILIQSGESERATKVLDVLMKSIDDEAHRRGRGDLWYLHDVTAAYALLGRDDEALDALEKSIAEKFTPGLEFKLAVDPMFDSLRANPRFLAVTALLARHRAEQRRKLEQMRAADLVPYRSRK